MKKFPQYKQHDQIDCGPTCLRMVAKHHVVYVILIAQVMLFLGSTSVDFVRSWILLHISTRINVSILTDFLIKLMRLPMSFFDAKMTGDIMQRMSDQGRIQSFLTCSTLNIIFSLFNAWTKAAKEIKSDVIYTLINHRFLLHSILC